MNYRHHFHAGNFADVQKHALLLSVLAGLTAGPRRLDVLDTHAGAGVYDLTGDLARRSREAEAGVARLMADPGAPGALAPLKAAVSKLNAGGEARLYPGSPLLIAGALRPGDSYRGCELRADDHASLSGVLAQAGRPGGPRLTALMRDGYQIAAETAAAQGRATLLLIDPPYERGDEYGRIVQTLAGVARKGGAASALVWAPIKDLETYDALLRHIESLPFAEGWAAEVRLRPLTDPMRLNGSALISLGLRPPPETEAICDWVARAAGEAGAGGRLTPLFL